MVFYFGKYKINVVRGSDTTINLLESFDTSLLESKKPFDRLLEDIKTITNAKSIRWWIAFNNKIPRGVILVHDNLSNNHSFLEYLWLNVPGKKLLESIVKALLKQWINTSKKNFTHLYVDITENSTIIESLKYFNFKFDKDLMNVYYAKTRYINTEPIDGVYLRKPEDEDFAYIYDNLVEPDLDRESPIYVDKTQFLHFAHNSPEIRDNWLVCVNEGDAIIGFGASFLQKHKDHVVPALYGPHSLYEDVENLMIREFITHWKIKGQKNLRIIRMHKLKEETAESMLLTHSTANSLARYIRKL